MTGCVQANNILAPLHIQHIALQRGERCFGVAGSKPDWQCHLFVTIHSSQFIVHSAQFTIHIAQLSQLTAHSSQLTAHSSQLTAHSSQHAMLLKPFSSESF